MKTVKMIPIIIGAALLTATLVAIVMSGSVVSSDQVFYLADCPAGAACFRCIDTDWDTWYEVGGCHDDPSQRHYVVKK